MEEREDLIKVIISAVLLAFLMVISHIFNINKILLIILYLVPYIIVGYEVIIHSFKKILKGKALDEDFLMTIATIGAFCLGEYPEAVAVMLFFSIGELFEDYASDKSKKSIASLMDMRPDFANLEKGDVITKVSPESVKIGDIIVVKSGEKIPLDGIVLSGASSVDTSSLTGESAPADILEGDSVLSGCVNIGGTLKIKVTKEYKDSTVSKILKLTEEASEKSAKSEKFITKFAKVYTPLVVISALFLAFIPPIFAGNLQEWIRRSLIFLVVSCPCALVVSVPLCFFMGIGRASKYGILIKGGEYIEKLSKSDTFIFDKTGTLTKGIFNVTKIYPENISGDDLLETAAYAESFSNHPIAKAIVEKYGKEIKSDRISNINELSGLGISAEIDGKYVLIGNTRLMKENDIDCRNCHHIGTTVHVAVDSEYAGYIVISDTLKENAKDALSSLKKLGIKKIIMLTGDNNEAGADVAKELSVDEFHTNLLPDDKLEIAKKIMSSSKNTVFIGDGINDAPVLAGADVGIAMGAVGSDAALEAADVTIMDDNLSKIPKAVIISRITVTKAYINIFFIIAVKLAVLLLGALGIVGMWAAVFADVGTLVVAILISLVDKNIDS